MNIEILSLFPNYFVSPLETSFLKRAQDQGLLNIQCHDIRDYTELNHKQVDDRPYGGGPGMLLRPEPVCSAIRNNKRPGAHVIYMSPKGAPLTAKKARQIAQNENLLILCGHYEGVDQRVLDLEVDEEISIGDYVLTNGCLSALVLIDAMMRYIPGVLGESLSFEQDSFENGLLDCPHYTRPEVFEGKSVPKELLSGDHSQIMNWREGQSRYLTMQRRPDLYAKIDHIDVDMGKGDIQCLSLKIAYPNIKYFSLVIQNILQLDCNFINEDLLAVKAGCLDLYITENMVNSMDESIHWSISSYSTWKKIKRKLNKFSSIYELNILENEEYLITFVDSCGLCWTLSLKTL